MTKAEIPVPPGFVVLSDAFEFFIRETKLIAEIDAALSKVNHKEMESIESASEMIQELIHKAKMPEVLEKEITDSFKNLDVEFVAVRSSATAEDGTENAWAGQLDSFLNTKRENVLENVQKCFASLFTPRAIFYRFEKGLHNTHISVAVVIQKMVNSEKSGIAFSVHPVTEDRNQMIIEASWGLGEAIVSGQITPDSYVVEKEPRNILDINIAEKSKGLFRVVTGGNEWKEISEKLANEQCLSGKEIIDLSELILRIENHYGFPCDIEWAFEKGKFYITQSRPITTLNKKDFPENLQKNNSLEKIFDDKNLYFNIGCWHCPVLEWETWLDWLNTEDAKKFNIPNDSHPSTVINHNYLLRVDGSYTWIKEEVFKEFSSNKYDLARNILLLGVDIGDQCVELGKNAKIDSSFSDFEYAYELMKRLRFPWMACFAISDAIETKLKEYSIKNKLNLEDVYSAIPQIKNSVNDDQKVLNQFKIKIDSENLPFDFVKIDLADKTLAKELKEYQKETEFIGTHHFWGEPRKIDMLIDAVVHATPIGEKTEENSDYKDLKDLFKIVALATKVRLECAQKSAELAYAFRPFLQKIAESLSVSYEDLLFLRINEIKEAYENKKVDKNIIQERKRAFSIYRNNNETYLVTGDELKSLENYFELNEKIENVQEIKGNIGNKGKVTGRVVIVFTPKDQAKLEKGMILVAPETTPDFIPVMGKASAFITDLGGITSHAAIVAREMNKPCIIGTKIATKVLKDGDLVEVDAEKGIVRIIK